MTKRAVILCFFGLFAVVSSATLKLYECKSGTSCEYGSTTTKAMCKKPGKLAKLRATSIAGECIKAAIQSKRTEYHLEKFDVTCTLVGCSTNGYWRTVNRLGRVTEGYYCKLSVRIAVPVGR